MLLERPVQRSASPSEIPPRPVTLRTLEDLRRWHRRLLHLSHASEVEESVAAEAAEFMAEGGSIGTSLDLPRDREEAQAMLDYWAGMHALSRARVNEPSSSPGRSPGSPLLAPFREEDAQRLVDAADRALSSLSVEDREVARRMLLRLTRLTDNGKWTTRDRASATDLMATSDEPTAQRVLRVLLDAGVIRIDEESGGQGFEIAHEAMLRQWQPLREWLERRLKFRQAADFWREHGRDPGALFDAGQLLAEAESYRDLGEPEREFAAASREKKTRSEVEEARREAQRATEQTVRMRRWFAVLIVAVCVMALLIYELQNLRRAAESANKQKDAALAAAVAEKSKTQEALDIAKAEEAKAVAAQAQAEESRAEAQARSDALKIALRERLAAVIEYEKVLRAAEKSTSIARAATDPSAKEVCS